MKRQRYGFQKRFFFKDHILNFRLNSDFEMCQMKVKLFTELL